MGNILAVAGKELRTYFASPIAYIVTGFWALVFGYFFYVMLYFFLQRSQQAMGMGPQSVNVNQDMIRYVLSNASVVVLFVLPAITMRTYSEEKRSGTIELLLTSPLTDLQIILGKFLGTLALYGAMLLVTVLYIALLFWFGNPEVKPILAGYLGLLLLGGCFLSIGLFISSLTKNQIVAAVITFVTFLMLWVIDWMASDATGTTATVLRYLSITGHFEDFSKGIIDTKHVIYYLSLITFGLFLTAKAVDTERWKG
ncbi:MAG TPA: ABC transporter permease subunit [Vicinamibacterales bacterium]|nr:ABC transporter permease subunit [Vicinamibacterales bacterium]